MACLRHQNQASRRLINPYSRAVRAQPEQPDSHGRSRTSWGLKPRVGCQKSAWPVSCGDAPGSAIGHDDQPCCPSVCCIWSLSGSAAGLCCSAAHRRRRMRNCWCCGTRSPSCAALSPGPGWTGPTPRCPRRADPAPAQKAAGAPAGHAGHRLAVAPPPGHKEVDLPESQRPAAGQRRDHRADRAARHRQHRLGIPADPGRAAQARPPGRRIHDPPDPERPEDTAGTQTAHRYELGQVPALPSRDDARRRPSFTWTAR